MIYYIQNRYGYEYCNYNYYNDRDNIISRIYMDMNIVITTITIIILHVMIKYIFYPVNDLPKKTSSFPVEYLLVRGLR